MVPDRMMCEDIIQGVFLKYFENLDNIKNKNSSTFWLFKSARNEIYTYYRRKKIRVDQFNVLDADDIEIDADENIPDEYERKELKEIIMKILETLPVEQKEVFYLKEYGGLSYKEISAVMDIDENLVKSRLFKTRQKLVRIIRAAINYENM